jgi:hypothetical protein
MCYILPSSPAFWRYLSRQKRGYRYVHSPEVVLSPILVRPVREQLEHDRVIRLLQPKYKRKFETAINPGNEQNAPVGGPPPWYPDLVLQSSEKSRRLLGVVEVETTESINHLEAMSQWGAFSRLRVPFHLYVPAGSVDSARRLATDLQIPVAELWSYTSFGEQIRFTLVHRTNAPEPRVAARPAAKAAAPRAATSRTRATTPVASRAARRPAAAAASARRKPATNGKTKVAPARRGPVKAAPKSASRSARTQKRR